MSTRDDGWMVTAAAEAERRTLTLMALIRAGRSLEQAVVEEAGVEAWRMSAAMSVKASREDERLPSWWSTIRPTPQERLEAAAIFAAKWAHDTKAAAFGKQRCGCDECANGVRRYQELEGTARERLAKYHRDRRKRMRAPASGKVLKR